MDFGMYFTAGVYAFASVLGFVLCAVGGIILISMVVSLFGAIIHAIIGDDEGDNQ